MGVTIYLFSLRKLTILLFPYVITNRELVDLGHGGKDSGRQLFSGTDTKPAIMFPPAMTAQWEEQV